MYPIYTDKKDLDKLQNRYIISSLRNSKEGIVARIIAEEVPSEYNYAEVVASLEDLYLYNFSKECKINP